MIFPCGDVRYEAGCDEGYLVGDERCSFLKGMKMGFPVGWVFRVVPLYLSK